MLRCVWKRGVTWVSYLGEILNSPADRQANFLLNSEFCLLNSLFSIRCRNGHDFGKLVGRIQESGVRMKSPEQIYLRTANSIALPAGRQGYLGIGLRADP